jgi:hypothetical protein
MFIADSGTLFLSIPDPGYNNSPKRGGRDNLYVLPFFVATKIIKLKIIFFLEQVKKILCSQNTNNCNTFYPKKFVFGFRVPGSGKKTYSGSRIQGQKGTGSLIRIRNFQMCALQKCCMYMYECSIIVRQKFRFC